ncbi:MAG: hypothetical protein ACO2PO_11120 [Candidatus Calescibacterium sp.]
MGIWFWVFVVWFVISTNLITFLLTYLFLQRKMYLLAIREVILFLTGGRGVEKTEKAEKKSEVEKKEQKETEKQETPHSFSTSSPSPHFSLQDLLLKKK